MILNEHLSRALFFFDLFMLYESTKHLKEAHKNMKKYRACGGYLYENTEETINKLMLFHGLS